MGPLRPMEVSTKQIRIAALAREDPHVREILAKRVGDGMVRRVCGAGNAVAPTSLRSMQRLPRSSEAVLSLVDRLCEIHDR